MDLPKLTKQIRNLTIAISVGTVVIIFLIIRLNFISSPSFNEDIQMSNQIGERLNSAAASIDSAIVNLNNALVVIDGNQSQLQEIDKNIQETKASIKRQMYREQVAIQAEIEVLKAEFDKVAKIRNEAMKFKPIN